MKVPYMVLKVLTEHNPTGSFKFALVRNHAHFGQVLHDHCKGPSRYLISIPISYLYTQWSICKKFHLENTGGPRLVRFLGPGKNRNMRNSN